MPETTEGPWLFAPRCLAELKFLSDVMDANGGGGGGGGGGGVVATTMVGI